MNHFHSFMCLLIDIYLAHIYHSCIKDIHGLDIIFAFQCLSLSLNLLLLVDSKLERKVPIQFKIRGGKYTEYKACVFCLLSLDWNASSHEKVLQCFHLAPLSYNLFQSFSLIEIVRVYAEVQTCVFPWANKRSSLNPSFSMM